MDFDRRQKPRIVPDELVFIQVEQDDGGRVLNVSEQGLCFEVFSTISVTQPIHFWFSFNLCDRIETLGRLVWMDAEKGIGGLKFTDLSQTAREQIRAWIGRFSADANRTETDGAKAEVAASDFMTHSIEPSLAEAAEPNIPFQHGYGVQATPETSQLTELVPLQRHVSAMRSQFIRGLFLGIVITSAVAIPVFKYANLQPKNSVKEVTGQMALENSSAQPGSEGPERPGATPPPLISSIAAKPEPSQPGSYSLSNPVRRPLGKGQSPVSPDEATRSKKNSPKPPQLWAAVQAGNAKAAVTLADLYLRGDGVPVNCDQARVLLLVASQKKNQEAIRKLRDWDKIGCPVS